MKLLLGLALFGITTFYLFCQKFESGQQIPHGFPTNHDPRVRVAAYFKGPAVNILIAKKSILSNYDDIRVGRLYNKRIVANSTHLFSILCYNLL